jgi:hypothetical protein
MTEKLSRKERLESIRELIEGMGINNLPSTRELGETYSVSHTVIAQDIKDVLRDVNDEERGNLWGVPLPARSKTILVI